MTAMLKEARPAAAGGCNFCTLENFYDLVFVISSNDPDRKSEMRICMPCMLLIIQQIPMAQRRHSSTQ